MVAVEAQANGLPCIFSDKISREVLLSDRARMLSLEAGTEGWAKAILETEIARNANATMEIQERGYSIDVEALKLQEMYEQLAES